MGTIQRNSDWEQRKQTQKGNIGESLIRQFFENHGFIIYQPVTDGSHLIDMYAEKNKQKVIAIDVKAKARRIYYPDTGIDLRHYERYKALSDNYNMPVWLLFVDEMEKSIYGNRLDVLDKPRRIQHKGRELIYPWDYRGIRYWPLEAMRLFTEIKQDDVEKLKALSSRSYEYAHV